MDAGCAESLRCGDPAAWRCGWRVLGHDWERDILLYVDYG
jgi:hypothetical protein